MSRIRSIASFSSFGSVVSTSRKRPRYRTTRPSSSRIFSTRNPPFCSTCDASRGAIQVSSSGAPSIKVSSCPSSFSVGDGPHASTGGLLLLEAFAGSSSLSPSKIQEKSSDALPRFAFDRGMRTTLSTLDGDTVLSAALSLNSVCWRRAVLSLSCRSLSSASNWRSSSCASCMRLDCSNTASVSSGEEYRRNLRPPRDLKVGHAAPGANMSMHSANNRGIAIFTSSTQA
mmetsp:Transcript_18494/g.69969  ORF Transcript_18494/g.69969 Transcript_18494/m.69969 type:complete len:229 (+) Transcript_18494:1214-1900(+)